MPFQTSLMIVIRYQPIDCGLLLCTTCNT